ncbi:rRNA maturation RNase YbeY [Amphibacillus cookii]|uniref:rRNA maturation RNase YbeY n=1 Tax=Amphibacillus cookii TaxID=767787 RepID=UPI00195C69E4|nr:rRNA maturation RNase YbeY [Amphibacillus cookii]MBM7543202.1 putative rRNA maturation factor [Amphibacillus cookii]
MQIDFHDETNTVDEDTINLISQLLHYAVKEEELRSEVELSINFVNNTSIQELNRNYRQIDRPTDVISFPLQEVGENEIAIIGEELPVSLGDIVISVEKAEEQANEYQHSLNREYGFLVIHGFLHLLGYDHLNDEDEVKMFSRQEELLDGFGLSRN